ncbi:MAG TPA: hypothetical protein VNZ94_04760 [Xanthobacteraceae bacterium]|nr:hypothetical protein [Xanthobacteraceae bacterium]
MIGLPKSASVMPVARHNPRAPAMFRPWVEVLERYGGMGVLCLWSENAGTKVAEGSELSSRDNAAPSTSQLQERRFEPDFSLLRPVFLLLCSMNSPIGLCHGRNPESELDFFQQHGAAKQAEDFCNGLESSEDC